MVKNWLLLAAALALVGCERDAKVASQNLSKAADMFEIQRRVVFYNGITGDYMLTIEGACSILHDRNRQLEVTCKVGPDGFKKHFLGLSDNVTYFVEHLTATNVSTYHHRVIFKPQSIISDIEIRGDIEQLGDAVLGE